jgi:hypothetical protein
MGASGSEHVKGQMLLQKTYSESGGGGHQETNVSYSLSVDGTEVVVLRHLVELTKYPSNHSTTELDEKWSIAIYQLINFIKENGNRVT